MGLFQTSVLKKYRKLQDKKAVGKAYKKYADYFHNSERQENIRESKEEQFQEGFLRELFVKVFDYTLNPEPQFNLTTELKNEKGAKKADGAILARGHDPLTRKALAVIELKNTKTKDLESIREQAFGYKVNHSECVYVITSNFEKLRFYINNAVDFEEFNLFTLNEEQFELLYLCLHKENVLNNVPLKIKTDSVVAEESITKKFYSDYSQFKRELFRDLVKQNLKNEIFRTELQKEDTERATKDIKQALFKKSQKLIDRFLFIFFAEDKGLLPPNSTLRILKDWDKLNDLDTDIPLYNRFKLYFKYLDEGRKGTDKKAEIFAYNGGLFKPDAILDSLILDSQILYKHTKALSDYDFESQVGVNILGHIFENSLNEIESVNAEIEGKEFDKQKTKRKKDGVFYTPKYITKYIVDNTIGKLCEDKKEELEIIEEEYKKNRKGRKTDTLKKLKTKLDNYRNWLLTLTILDPACGSGAFLKQALDFLIKEHTYIDELETSLLGGGMVMKNIENTILENNIYGVDLNEESVEIAKLSLWLRTAQPRRKLNTLNNNIKCGNSLIDSKIFAGDKAFNWQNEFPHIFTKKDKKAWHITTATHNSRYSQRMYDNYVKTGDAIWLNEKDEIIITKTIAEIVKNDNLNVIEYNICGDHMHLLLVCEENDRDSIVGKIKGKSYRLYHSNKGINPLVRQNGEKTVALWTQKFGKSEIKDENYLNNTIEYIRNNRIKHELPKNKEIEKIKKEFLCSAEHAFRTEYNGGFDVVIGNPPYVHLEAIKDESEKLSKIGYYTFDKRGDLYPLFVEKGINILKKKGIISYIMPNKWLQAGYGKNLREYFLTKELVELIDFGDIQIFDGATTYPCIFIARNNSKNKSFIVSVLKSSNSFDFETNVKLVSETFETSMFNGDTWVISSKNEKRFIERLSNEFSTLKQNIEKTTYRGVLTGLSDAFLINEEVKNTLIKEDGKASQFIHPFLQGRDMLAYAKPISSNYLLLFEKGFTKEKFGNCSEQEGWQWIKNNYPSIYNWLLPFEERGLKRTDKGDFWWELRACDYYKEFDSPKIMYQAFQVKPCFVYDEQRLYCNNSVWFIPTTNKVLLGILNSKLGWWLISKYCTQIQSGHQLIWKYFGQIPIPKKNDILLSNEVNDMLKISDSYLIKAKSFAKYLQSQFNIEKLSKKLQNWHGLEFSDFIKELNKAIKKANKEVATATTSEHVHLTKKDEMEWMELFEEKKAEAQTLKTEIEKTDKEIDQMVYELYGLSEEEIFIIENS